VLIPARVDERVPYELRVVARATRPTAAALRIYRNDEYLGETAVQLGAGRAEVISVRRPGTTPGLYRYRAVLDVDDPTADTIPQNNEAVASIQVSGQPRILIVDADTRASRHLATALRGQRFGVDVMNPGQLPATLSGFRPWAAVVLANVPAYDLTSVQQEALEAYVRDLGRGLAMIGGDQSFGVGGYFGTPIERALPVNMDITDKTRFPKLGMVLAIDKSCSMGGGAGSKLGMAIEASVLTIDLLQERDLFGLVAFDDAASWVVPVRPVGDGAEAERLARSLRTGGGTDIYPALDQAISALAKTDASLKHVVLLSDGITGSAAFQPLLQGGVRKGITTTSLAFGSDADRATMQDLANWGGGQYYLVTDPKAIPAIFTRETLIASGAFLFEEPFKPAFVQRSDVLVGLGPGDLPELFGYVTTEPKPRTVRALDVPPRKSGEAPTPLLIHGRYGLGRSLAFTSDATTRWAQRWVGTESYTQLWSQIGRWLAADADAESLDVAAEIREGELVVTVDAFDESGQFLNFLTGEARVIAPDLTVTTLELSQVGPGRYRGDLPVDQDGAWLVAVALADGQRAIGKAVTEAVQPWSPEYRIGASGGSLMAEIGRLGGGGELGDPAMAFARPEQARAVPIPLWPWLVGLAALLVPADVATRRLRLGLAREGRGELLVGGAATPIRRTGVTTARAQVQASADRADASPPPPVAPRPEPGSEVKADSYAGRLLAARKRAGLRDGDGDGDEGGAP
jgi:Ca-activated chloride channel homolog